MTHCVLRPVRLAYEHQAGGLKYEEPVKPLVASEITCLIYRYP